MTDEKTPDSAASALSAGLERAAKTLGYDLHWHSAGKLNITMGQLEATARIIAEAERERICAAIKAEDDHCADGDYMMDSDDCISVARGTWKRPDWNGSNAKLTGLAPGKDEQ